MRQAEEYIKSIGFSFIKLFDGQTGLYQRVEIIDPSKKIEVLGEERNIIVEKPKLTICLTSPAGRSRRFEWFFDSLKNQLEENDPVKIIIVDFLAEKRNKPSYETYGWDIKWVEPKPTIWQGKHKITKDDWWALSNARNTAFCLCEKAEWIRLSGRPLRADAGDGLRPVKRAINSNYAVCGSYQKRSKMEVERGFIKGYDKLIGDDTRMKQAPNGMNNSMSRRVDVWLHVCTAAGMGVADEWL